MTLPRPRIHWPSVLLASSLVLLLACSGSSSNTNGAGGSALDLNGFGQRYKLADNEVSGWAQDTAAAAFALYDNTNLTDRIDGPATEYYAHGMKFALYQNLKGPDANRICGLTAMDFGTAANAKSMVDYKKQLESADISIPPYDASVAIASKKLTGITVFAYFSALYLELVLDGYGYPPNVTLASQDGAALLQALEAKPKLQ
jgi:hypothetical protein